MVVLSLLSLALTAMGLGLVVLTVALTVHAARWLFGRRPPPVELDEPVPFKLAGGPYREMIPRCDKCGAPTTDRRPVADPDAPTRQEAVLQALHQGLRSMGISVDDLKCSFLPVPTSLPGNPIASRWLLEWAADRRELDRLRAAVGAGVSR